MLQHTCIYQKKCAPAETLNVSHEDNDCAKDTNNTNNDNTDAVMTKIPWLSFLEKKQASYKTSSAGKRQAAQL